MVRLSFSELNSWANRAGNSIGEGLKAAKSGACDLYRVAPGFMTGTGIINTPAGALSKGVWDNLCGDEPAGLPVPPDDGFTGGQCSCIVYDVRLERTRSDGAVLGGVLRVYGEVTGLDIEYVPSPADPTGEFGSGYINVVCRGFVNSPCQPEPVSVSWIQGGLGRSEVGSAKILSVVRVDGQVDDCGNPPPAWTPGQRLPPPPDDLEDEYQPPKPPGGLAISLPIIYAPISLEPVVNINVGGIDFNFDLGGVTFAPAIEPDGGVGNKPPGDEPPSSQEPPDLSPVLDGIEDLKGIGNSNGEKASNIENALEKDPSLASPDLTNDYNRNERESTDAKQEDGIVGLSHVLIKLTQLPIERKFQSGDGSPDVYYAGWFEWLTEGKPSPREPIHFSESLFSPSKRVTGYAYTLTNRAEGYAVVYTRK